MGKGQMELMGLLVIVMIFGALFLLGFLYLRSSQLTDLPEQSFSEKTISGFFVKALSKTYVAECRSTYSTVARLCIAGTNEDCDFCGEAERVADLILAETLDVWQENYRFTISKNGEEVNFTLLNEDYDVPCDENSPKEAPGIELIPLFPLSGEAHIMLEICKN